MQNARQNELVRMCELNNALMAIVYDDPRTKAEILALYEFNTTAEAFNRAAEAYLKDYDMEVVA